MLLRDHYVHVVHILNLNVKLRIRPIGQKEAYTSLLL